MRELEEREGKEEEEIEEETEQETEIEQTKQIEEIDLEELDRGGEEIDLQDNKTIRKNDDLIIHLFNNTFIINTIIIIYIYIIHNFFF